MAEGHIQPAANRSSIPHITGIVFNAVFRKEVPGPFWWRSCNFATPDGLAKNGAVADDQRSNSASPPKREKLAMSQRTCSLLEEDLENAKKEKEMEAQEGDSSKAAKMAKLNPLGDCGYVESSLEHKAANSSQGVNSGHLGHVDTSPKCKVATLPQEDNSGHLGHVEKDLLSLLEEDLESAKKEKEMEAQEVDSSKVAKMAKLNESSQGGHLGESDDVTSSNETPHPFGNVPPTPPVRLAPWSPPIPTENPTASS